MNMFDIIGPIMIGPSSSHTAGVVRIGLLSKSILGITPKDVTITWYGSFSKTYIGHGSDKAIIAGLLGLDTFDERIRDSFSLAKEQNMTFNFVSSTEDYPHPNTVKITAKDDLGNVKNIVAKSVGGGAIEIVQIDDLSVSIDGSYDTLITTHIDKSGVIKNVANILYENKINIATMKVHRSEKNGNAMMIIESDNDLDNNVLLEVKQLPNIKHSVIVKKI